MKLRVRHHVNPLRLEYQVARARRMELPPGRDVEVELGCAEGDFLFARAAQRPELAIVGVEIREELVGFVNRRAREAGADVRAVFSNLNVELERLFAPGQVSRFYLNFPDPWFKKRQRKRRVMDGDLVQAIARTLRPGGELYVATDIFDLALDAMAAVEEHDDLFANILSPWSFWKSGNPFGVLSRRETYCESVGWPVWRIRYRQLSAGSAPATPAP